MNQVRKCIFNSFCKTIPDNRIRVSLSIFDDIILKTNNNDIEDILENIDDLREIILYMLSFEKTVRDEQQTDSDQQLKQVCDLIGGSKSKKKYFDKTTHVSRMNLIFSLTIFTMK